MERVLNVAEYICKEYLRQSGEPIDELKLQKLLYFAQRESLAINDEPLFKEPLEGWVHGPVSKDVRTYFLYSFGIATETSDIEPESKRILNNVIEEYGRLASWRLRDLSHEEISWKKSRTGLADREPGQRVLSIADIREDAKKVRPIDHTWGMFYDEFDDYEGVNSDGR